MKRILRWFLVGAAVVALTACGGGSSSDDSNKAVQVEKRTVKGYVVDDPIIGATVKILSLDNVELQTATTDSNGSYSLEVDQTKIADGFILEATGGKMNGLDFNGTLRAIYKSSDDLLKANVTLMTSLVAKMVMDDNSTNRSGNILSRRDEVLKKLIDMGMVKASDWNSENPSLINIDQLRATCYIDGIDTCIDRIIDDVTDNQLSKINMSVFPKAHAGIVKVDISPYTHISLFPGQNKKILIKPEFYDSNDSDYIIKIEQSPEWVTVENNQTVLVAPPSNIETFGDFDVSAELTNSNIKIGRIVKLKISVLKGAVLLSGEIGPNGGKIENQWKDISVSVDAGVLSKNYAIKLVASINKDGELVKHFEIDPEMTREERSQLKVIMPVDKIIKNNYLDTNASYQINRSANPYLNSCLTESWASYGGNGFKYPFVWSFGQGGFIDTWDYDLNGYPRAVKPGANDTISKCAYVLRSRYQKFKFDPENRLYDENLRGKEAVLFVHGFVRSGDLGGYDKKDNEKYFGNFPALIEKLGYLPFEFDWRTNANFKQVANELAKSIQLITEKTGKQVHIVAHSYGGVLVRTLVEGLALDSKYDTEWAKKHIATITTVGTPHQGIFSERTTVNNILFPPGFTDTIYGFAAKFCKAITCYQMGKDWDEISEAKSVYGVGGVGELIARLNQNMSRYPDIYTQVLIGLNFPDVDVISSVKCDMSMPDLDQCIMTYSFSKKEDEGDGDYLISLDSQRIVSFSQNGFNPLLDETYIKEHLLGFRKVDWSGFEPGYEDWIMSKLNERIDDKPVDLVYSNYPLQINAKQDQNLIGYTDDFVAGYIHTTGDYTRDILFQYIDFYGFDGYGTATYRIYGDRNSEVGIQDCNPSSNLDDCKNATFNYVRYMIQEHPASAIDEPLKILIRGDVRFAGVIDQNVPVAFSADTHFERSSRGTTAVPFPVTVEVYTGLLDNLLSTGETTRLKDDGTYELNVTFVPDTNYTVIAYPEGDTVARIGAVVRASASKFISTLSSLEESILRFPTITLYDSRYQEGNLTISVVDGQSGNELNNFSVDIINTSGNIVNRSNNADSGYTVSLPKADYIIRVNKDGYNSSEVECSVIPENSNECRVSIVSNASIANGQITAVLTWDETPSDLDSHLVRKTNGNEDYHIYYGHKNDTDANLDVDDITSYGPETITIDNIDTDSVYTYYVHNFSGGAGSVLPNSGAKVELNFNGTQRTFYVPNEEGQYWKVFEIDHGRIIPCTVDCVKDDTSTLVRGLDKDSDAYLFENLPAK